MTQRPITLVAAVLSLAVACLAAVAASRDSSPGRGAGTNAVADFEAAPQAASDAASAGVRLSRPRTALRSVSPAPIEYWLAADAKKVTIEILDAKGRVIRAFTGAPGDQQKTWPAGEEAGGPALVPLPTTHRGPNRFTWDLRYPGAIPVEGPGASSPPPGPLALPGLYQVRLTVDGGASLTQPYVIEKDPRLVHVTEADLRAQFDLAIQVRDMTSEANQAVNDIRSLTSQVAARLKDARSPAIPLAADVVTRRLTEVAELLHPAEKRNSQAQPNRPTPLHHRLAALQRSIENGDARPADTAFVEFRSVSEELAAAMSRLLGVLRNEVAAFNRLLENGQQKPLELPPTLPR